MRGHARFQPIPSELFSRENPQRQFQNPLCPRPELLLLSRSGSFLSNRFLAGCDRFFKISVCLLHCRIPDFDRGAARAGCMRFFVSLWMVSGIASQNPHKKMQYQKAAFPYLSQICHSGCLCDRPAHDDRKRGGFGRPVFLQIYLSGRYSGRRHPAVDCRWGHPRQSGRAVHMEKLHFARHCGAFRVLLSPVLQMDLSIRRLLCAVQ